MTGTEYCSQNNILLQTALFRVVGIEVQTATFLSKGGTFNY